MYKNICNKLGCAPSELKTPKFDGEDDSWKDPISVLTASEIDFLYQNGYLNPKQGA